MALFGGASFSSKRAAFLVPLAALFLSDLAIGFYTITPVIYASFALIVCIGLWLRQRQSISRIAGAAVVSALLFFVLANFGIWVLGNLYPKTWNGLASCYVAAIPYFRNTLASNLLYSTLLFGGLALAENYFPRLRERAVAAV